ncbi:hypothetical protein IU443_25640 [Nocardia farcinica]|uniref:hypothetical protein n=1 Tax=Nocardia farcinica TaxID=37329 RepID=UPI0018953D61|nr:hypothetical protein [Nocardia farcinica]MBF6393320.1 hypothetical protein [Nocardia farcinica]
MKAHRDEIAGDGYRVVSGEELRSLMDLSLIDPRTPSLALFPRRAVLRVGMLLRDSVVARRVRDYLLDAEPVTPAPMPLPGLVDAHRCAPPTSVSAGANK